MLSRPLDTGTIVLVPQPVPPPERDATWCCGTSWRSGRGEGSNNRREKSENKNTGIRIKVNFTIFLRPIFSNFIYGDTGISIHCITYECNVTI